MTESGVSRSSSSGPRRPSFIEHVTSVSVQDALPVPRLNDPPMGAWPHECAPPVDSSINSAAAVTPDAARPQPVEPDDVNQPKEMLALQRAGFSLGGLTIAMWLFGALVVGLAIGAVTGSVAALILIG